MSLCQTPPFGCEITAYNPHSQAESAVLMAHNYANWRMNDSQSSLSPTAERTGWPPRRSGDPDPSFLARSQLLDGKFAKYSFATLAGLHYEFFTSIVRNQGSARGVGHILTRHVVRKKVPTRFLLSLHYN